MTEASSLYLKQLLSGRDFAKGHPVAGQMANFAYLVGCQQKKQCLVVDPSWDPLGLAQIARDDGMEIVGIVATHGHPDHVGGAWMGFNVPGVAELAAELAEVPVHVHADEADMVKVMTKLGDERLALHQDGEAITVGELKIDLIHAPGHSPGGLCLLFAGHVITGDVLFVGGCGRVDLPGSDVSQMRASLRRLAELDDATVLLPGHDYGPAPRNTMGKEKKTNPILSG